ncbi:hypothetical protein ACIA8C_36745 [Nocardia sp. NPDC051321]|uniref:hypothetical protein n=1 Tax=Nocardia sp. NPDC051321 TaxID=3364323 RepID=UPI0037B2D359
MKSKIPSNADEGALQPSVGLPVTFDRPFILWRYASGHSQLVLRSLPNSASDYIEVTFQGVVGMKLVTNYEPLTIDIAGSAQIEEMTQFSGLRKPPRTVYRCYVLKSDRDEGLVMCLGVYAFVHPKEANNGQVTVEHKDSRLIFES